MPKDKGEKNIYYACIKNKHLSYERKKCFSIPLRPHLGVESCKF